MVVHPNAAFVASITIHRLMLASTPKAKLSFGKVEKNLAP